MTQSFDRVVADQLRFKQRLRIGEDAYTFLRTKKALYSLWDTAGVGWTGVSVAKSAAVAGAFFAPAAPTGVMAWLGLAAPAVAVTPVGWLVAAGVAAGGGYYGVTRWMASGTDRFVDTIPKFINTPLDLLGAELFDLMAPLAMRVADADGSIDDAERDAIADHFVHDWSLDADYVAAGLKAIEEERDSLHRLAALARSLAELQRTNPDCGADAMQAELMLFLREVVEADGVVTPKEERALRAIEAVFRAERAPISRDRQKQARATVRTTAGAFTVASKATRATLVASSEVVANSLGNVAGRIRGTGSGWAAQTIRQFRALIRPSRDGS